MSSSALRRPSTSPTIPFPASTSPPTLRPAASPNPNPITPSLPLSEWHHPQITLFLSTLKLSHHAQAFQENDITGAVILELGLEELKELGVGKVGERVRLLGGIRELRRRFSGGGAGGSVQGGLGVGSGLGRSGSVRRQGTDEFPLSTSSSNFSPSLTSSSSFPSTSTLNYPSSSSSTQPTPMSEPLGSSQGGMKRLNASRPPPLHLESSSSSSTTTLTRSSSLRSNAPSGPTRTVLLPAHPRLAPGSLPSARSAGSGSNSSEYASSPIPGSTTARERETERQVGRRGYQPPESGARVMISEPTDSTASSYSGSGSGSGLGLGLSPSNGGGIVPPPMTPRSLGSQSLPHEKSPGGPGMQQSAQQYSVNPTSGRLRAPLPSNGIAAGGGKRSPSPALGHPGVDGSGFADRPLPPAPSGRSLPREEGVGIGGTMSSGRPSTSTGITGGGYNHRKTGSLAPRPGTGDRQGSAGSGSGSGGSPTKRGFGFGSRPSTSSAAESAVVVHPYAVGGSPKKVFGAGSGVTGRFGTSPTKDGLYNRAGGREPEISPTRADTGHAGQRSGGITPTTAKEDFGRQRPSVSEGTGHPSRNLSISEQQPPPTPLSLEDVRRRCVKFINADDGTSRVVDLASCESGVDVMEKALKKFGKWRGYGVPGGGGGRGEGDSESEGSEEMGGLDVDGWGVFMEGAEEDAEIGEPLTEAELLAICHAPPDDPSRQHGLTLRRTRKLGNRKNMEKMFGEIPPPPMSPTSPSYTGPRLGFVKDRAEDVLHTLPPRSSSGNSGAKKMNRASTVSIMSGLGVPMTNVQSNNHLGLPNSPDIRGTSAPTSRSPSGNGNGGSFLASKGKKMYNFFGHRPPSELIATHLADYFPSAKRKELEKTARNSMLRLGGANDTNRLSFASGRDSMMGDPTATTNRLPSRFSVASSIASSERLSRNSSSLKGLSSPPPKSIKEDRSAEDNDLPRVSVSTDDGLSIRPTIDGETPAGGKVSPTPPLLPPFLPDGESFSDSLKPFSPQVASSRPPSVIRSRRGSGGSSKSRLSMVSQFRRSRRKSDAGSMITVDEITAEVERRRASVITFAESEEEDDEEGEEAEGYIASEYGRRLSGLSPGLVPSTEGEEEDDGDVEESEEEETESEESEEEEEEVEEVEEEEEQTKFTSTGSKRSIKWMKGALLGAGSFGQVFLGLDAQSGVLMAVKQVDLGTAAGGGGGEERKKGMIVALEREIELLKDLQHEHIVQYLDSSTDLHHLNIFLEYVPGGTVSSLLAKYGPFEEPLVQRWIKQTLTGLEYLHGRGIIHRDIKGANILVDNKGGIKIADFGISKKVENNLLSTTKLHRQSLQGSVFWMAPEVVKQTSYTKKADIWSVGCLIVEMLTGERPWRGMTQMQALFRIGSQAKPTTPSDISIEAVDILRLTFMIDQDKRPYAEELLRHGFIVGGGDA